MQLATLALCLSVGLIQDDASRKEIAKLKGTWSVVSVEDPSGAKAPDEVIKTFKIVFTDDKMIFKAGDRMVEATFKVDPTKKPVAIDFTRQRDGKDESAKGIYQFDGDLLKLCASEGTADRPKEFKTDAASKTGLIVLKKDKE